VSGKGMGMDKNVRKSMKKYENVPASNFNKKQIFLIKIKKNS
jgi:hypothetical protein